MDPVPAPDLEKLKFAFEHTKLAFEFYRDMTNQLITLSTAALAFTVTFSKDVAKYLSKGKLWVLIGTWFWLVVSIGAGIVTQMGINGALLDHEPHPLRAKVQIASLIQFAAFFIGAISLGLYGYLLTRSIFVPSDADTAQPRAADVRSAVAADTGKAGAVRTGAGGAIESSAPETTGAAGTGLP